MILWVLVVAPPGVCFGYAPCHWPSREKGLYTSMSACEAAARYYFPEGEMTTFRDWKCEPFPDDAAKAAPPK